jgi:hypothetical protein
MRAEKDRFWDVGRVKKCELINRDEGMRGGVK